jgi:hypothetical protein
MRDRNPRASGVSLIGNISSRLYLEHVPFLVEFKEIP